MLRLLAALRKCGYVCTEAKRVSLDFGILCGNPLVSLERGVTSDC